MIFLLKTQHQKIVIQLSLFVERKHFGHSLIKIDKLLLREEIDFKLYWVAESFYFLPVIKTLKVVFF